MSMDAKRRINKELRLAGNKLLDPPTSVHQLLPLLDHDEYLLLRVDQTPTKSTREAISPLTSALVLDALLNHYNVDVKVAVASCLGEMIRITAPEPPYDDEKMKDVFELIASAFEGLRDKSGRSYTKRVNILETMSNVKSCVIMLDLECDALIVEMFKLFLANIRHYHPEIVFSSMEKIMALVIEENDNISSEILLTPLLACLQKGNQEILPIAVKLAEKVFEKCFAKLKACLTRGTISLDDYTDVVTPVLRRLPCSCCASNENASTDPLVQQNAIPRDADENVCGPSNSMVADENASELKMRTALQFFCPRRLQ